MKENISLSDLDINTTVSQLMTVNVRSFDKIITEYDKKYCELIINHCSFGNSPESFAGRYHISPDHLAIWASEHKDFSAACKSALCAQLYFWETQMTDALSNEALSYRLATINRMIGEITGTLFKNSLRKSLFSNYEDKPQESKSELESKAALEDFIGST